MLPFRNRTNRRSGGPSEPHAFVSPAATISPFRRRPLPTSIDKSSLRGRLKGITGNITRRRATRSYKNRMPYTPNPWHNLKPNDDLLCVASADDQHIGTGGQTWPAIRKSISTMASSFHSNYGSIDPCDSAETPHLPSTQHSNAGFDVSRGNSRRWFTMASRGPPVTFTHPTGRTRRSSFSTISEVVPREDHEPAPQLPKLAESSNFLDSLARTGLFRRFTPPSEANNTAGPIKVQNIAGLKGDLGAYCARPIVTRLPLRLRNSDVLYQTATGGYAVNKRLEGGWRGSQVNSQENNSSPTNNENKAPPKQRHRTSQQDPYRTSYYSRLPIEWLDRILETSYATRNPISPKICVNKATMDFLKKSKTCFYVEFPQGRNVPEPQRCYPGFRAALEDICDRFGDWYAPFAAYNAVTRMITLYASGTPRPENKFIDDDTAIFDLWLARSAWVRSTATYPSSAGTTTTTKSTSRDTSEDLTEASDCSRAGSDETWATDPEDEEPKTPKDAGKQGA
ncbi:hypothetical protein F5Y07DRAFT_207132 [Xylaria sp. FL0933]|nr:hypothetical protein F5Y07DRAFT_207132 [Xylaria sp. FL0933]